MTGTAQAVWASVMGTLATGVAVLALGIRYDADLPAIVGFGFGVAVVGFVLSVGMLGWVYLSDADSLYLYPATVASSSLLLFVSVDSIDRVSTGEGGTALPLTLVVAALLIIVGMSLVFVDQIRADG